MAKLFNGIREKIISEKPSVGRTTNYLKYAIGEIVLVVIGILIALSINNWNEHRKNANQELKLLQSFKIGLEKDLSDIDVNISTHTTGVNSANLILNLLEKNQTYNDSLAKHFSYAMQPSTFVNSTSAFETLKSKGIDLISNENLRSQLINVYDAQYTFFQKYEAQFLEEHVFGLRNIFPSRFEESYIFNLESDDFLGEIVPLNFENLKTDQEFLYYFKSIKNRTYLFVNYFYKNLRAHVVDLINEIEKEIEKNKNN
ncbi:hypothetical protein MNBD_BACTEROID02-226 [hydrothermal vent metagenome]|uniref:Uncharacterized protein n=1 Tax=hydrothermal vent metagenome TaxID=652676 RepID=A0A3B0QXW5_9ZZZZ